MEVTKGGAIMFIEYNPNPRGIHTGDCVIRAICKALDVDWEKVYMELTVKGLEKAMLKSSLQPTTVPSVPLNTITGSAPFKKHVKAANCICASSFVSSE